MGKGLWGSLGVGSALVAALMVVAFQSPEKDWGSEARAAAKRLVLDRTPDRGGVDFAGVEVRPNGKHDERWGCGSYAVRDEEGSLDPFRDFWITVTKVADTWFDIRDVRANDFGRDDFLDRNSAHFQACFADAAMG